MNQTSVKLCQKLLARDHNNLMMNANGYAKMKFDDEHGDITVAVNLMHDDHHFERNSTHIIQRYELNYPVEAQTRTLRKDLITTEH